MRVVLSFFALFASVVLVQLGSGSLGPLDALSGSALDFTGRQIGLLGSAHFLGFIVGCIVTPWLMAGVGHSRAFAALVSIGTIAALLHPVLEDPIFWAVLRVGNGAAVAGAYTVIESWLHAKLENKDRGRVSGLYRLFDIVGSIGAQVMIAGLEPASYISYNLIACLMCLSLLPLVLSRAVAPPLPKTPRVNVLRTIRLSPLGAAGVVTVGLTNSSFRMVGPVFGEVNGLSQAQIGLFLASGLVGGALAQPFVGWVSDRFDRRIVLIIISAFALLACFIIAGQPSALSFERLAICAMIFGACAFPLYSISAAHANDFAEPDSVVELNASLVMLFGLGAIVSPLLASELIERFGPPAMFLYIAAAHALLIAFGVYRMTRRPTRDERTPYTYRPRTSITLERLLKSKNSKGGR